MSRRTLIGILGVFLLLAVLLVFGGLYWAGAASVHNGWSPEELAQMQNLRFTPEAVQAVIDRKNVSNELLHDIEAISLGQQLFNDPRLSASGQVSCASCHQPEHAYQDQGQMTYQLNPEARHRAPGLLGVGLQDWFFWDGRADSLWSQALASLENPFEHATTRLQAVRHLCDTYRAAYPELLQACRGLALPADLRHAAPNAAEPEVVAAWNALPDAQQKRINQLFVRIGKSLAAFEARLLPPESRFDLYVEAITAGAYRRAASLLSEREAAGLKLFLDARTGCFNCHHGPMFSNAGFSAIGTDHPGEVMWDRQHGVTSVLQNEFNCINWPSSDPCSKLLYIKTEGADLVGAYKVPSLRNLRYAVSFMHDGQSRDLAAVIDHYQNPDLLPLRHIDIRPMALLPHQREQLLAFLNVLGGEMFIRGVQ